MCKEFHVELWKSNSNKSWEMEDNFLKMEKDRCKNNQENLKLAMKKVE